MMCEETLATSTQFANLNKNKAHLKFIMNTSISSQLSEGSLMNG
jgi:hypothetical protein